ncbi:uncharacterized protein ISCGN_024004 [Ixodes scapularis]
MEDEDLRLVKGCKSFQLSSTDLPQAWGQHAKDVVKTKYAVRSLMEIPFCPKFKRPALPAVERCVVDRLMEGLPHICPVAIHKRKRTRKETGGASTSAAVPRP